MAVTLFERGVADEKKKDPAGTSIVTGVVVNDCDLVMQGKVLVRIPSLDLELPARITGPGGGSGAGLFYSPRAGDEVLIGMSNNDPVDAYVLGGLWSTTDPPPLKTPIDPQTKRVLRTGVTRGFGHEVEFDDLKQAINITSSTGQKILIDPLKIEISNTTNTLKLTLDNATQTLTIAGVMVKIAASAYLELKAPLLAIKGEGPGGAPGIVGLDAKLTEINGTMVQINPPVKTPIESPV